ncbi:hypothetical protein F5887DRAFT_988205, partial [Amanita rubescens]
MSDGPVSFVGLLSDDLSTIGTPSINSQILAYDLDIFLAAVIGLIVLLRLPRGLARFWKSYEWCNGHILGYTRPSQRAAVSRRPSQSHPTRHPSASRNRGRSPGAEKAYAATDESHTLYSHAAMRHNHKGQRIQPSYPPHVSSHPAFLRPLIHFLKLSYLPGYSNLQIFIMLAYFSILLFALLYKSNVWTDPDRAGWIAASQLPFLFAFAAKNNVIGWSLGVEYQKFIFLHRYLGQLIVIAANVHGIGYFYKWSLNGTMAINLAKKNHIWGVVCLSAVDFVYVFSTSLWRTKSYNFFLTTHFVGYTLTVVALYKHWPSTLPFIIALLVPFGLDYIFRFFKSRFVTATIRPIPSLSATRIEIPSLNSGWRAGQHVRVRIFSSGLGWLGWTESHPFTIASAPVISSKQGRTVGEEGLILICKKAGGWTGKLYDMAKKSGYIEAGIADGVDIGKTVALMIEGPYSGPGHAIYASYSAVVMMVGGSGITFALSIIQDLVQKDLQAQSRVKIIDLVWMVQNPDAMVPFIPLFTALLESSPTLSISVHYTRAYAPRPNNNKSTKNSKENQRGRVPSNNSDQLFPVIPQGLRISLSAGRPGQAELASVVENSITRTVSIGSGAMGHEDERGINGVLVGVCGPAGLGVQANAAVKSIDSARKKQAGGVDVYEE